MKSWAETLQQCIDEKWKPELMSDFPDVNFLGMECAACKKAKICKQQNEEDGLFSHLTCSYCPIFYYAGGLGCDSTPFGDLFAYLEDCAKQDKVVDSGVVKGFIASEIDFLEMIMQKCKNGELGHDFF